MCSFHLWWSPFFLLLRLRVGSGTANEWKVTRQCLRNVVGFEIRSKQRVFIEHLLCTMNTDHSAKGMMETETELTSLSPQVPRLFF